MKFVIIITSGPYGDTRLRLALDMALSVTGAGHELNIFLYGNGVYNALNAVNPAADEFNPKSVFEKLSKVARIYFCETTGLRRGVDGTNASETFISSGLGELSDMINSADRVVSL